MNPQVSTTQLYTHSCPSPVFILSYALTQFSLPNLDYFEANPR